MKIYKQKHRLVKDRLKIFAKQFSEQPPEARYSTEFWKKRYWEKNFLYPWDGVIIAYMAFWCDDEDLRFIDAAFFRDKTMIKTGAELHLSERACYLRRDRILDDLSGFAVQSKILDVDMTNGFDDREEKTYVTDEKWEKISLIIAEHTNCKPEKLRAEVEAMAIADLSKKTWRELADIYGNWKTIYNRFNAWNKSGVWALIRAVLESDGSDTDK